MTWSRTWIQIKIALEGQKDCPDAYNLTTTKTYDLEPERETASQKKNTHIRILNDIFNR